MSKGKKRFLKLQPNPTNVSFEALQQVLADYGFAIESIKGSHYTFRAQIANKRWKLTIPYRKPVLPTYVKQAIAAIQEIQQAQVNPDDDDKSDDLNP
jgi:predicted RNA binding protein YcfA (HicA-like mRNA interferase family)